MSTPDLRKQLEACLTSDLIEEARLVWSYLIACRPAGCGNGMLAKALSLPEAVIDESLEVLREEGLARMCVLHHGGVVWKPVRYATSSSKAKKGVSAAASQPVSVHAKAKEFIKVYQRLRKAAVGRELSITASNGRRFEDIAGWMAENGVGAVQFMRFAIERTEWLEDKMPFPTPSILSGDWIREQWNEQRSSPTGAARKSVSHAGRSYGEADTSTKGKLKAGGLDVDGLTEAEVRYIETCAATAREVGAIGTVDERWLPFIERLLEED